MENGAIMGRIYYATNRNPNNPTASTNFDIDFNGLSPGNLIFGAADVDVPPGHTPAGLPNEASNAAAIHLSDPSPGDFSSAAKREIIAGPPHLILTVHGFQYLFWESVARAEYLGRWFSEGTFPNPNTVVMFGWPSAGDLLQYERDYDHATRSGAALAKALTTLQPLIDDFRAHHGEEARVTLLAHSMGNHVVDAAFGASPPMAPPTYNRVILAAADEGRNELTPPGNLARAVDFGDRVYVYYNNQDIPLILSGPAYHHFVVRLGIDGPPNKDDFKTNRVSFINCSVVGAGTTQNHKDSEGHQYYRLIPEVRDDLCAVMRIMADGTIPNRVYRDDPRYGWENYWLIEAISSLAIA
jgi:esterase/lipase superfamily enzyme